MDDLKISGGSQKRRNKINLEQGILLRWKDYKFPDGMSKEKLVLILSPCIDGVYFVVALPTSNADAYIYKGRSLTDTVCFPKGSSTCFQKDTVVDLKNLDRIEKDKIIKAINISLNLAYRQLSKVDLEKIYTAVKNAKTLTSEEKIEILGDYN